MNRIDLSNLGGFPLEQDTLAFMQSDYQAALSAIARLCGDKTILYGVEVNGGNVSPGWISYNGELILFQGGATGNYVVIEETPTQVTFEDNVQRDAYFTKTAKCGAVGAFLLTDLVPLLSLQNVWRPGDIKERYCDDAYIAANFDANGYGINAEKGWRILSAAYPDTAGKVFVNRNPADLPFNQVAKTGGAQTKVLTKDNLPNVQIDVPIPAANTSQGQTGSGKIVCGSEANEPVNGPTLKTNALGLSLPVDIMNPYFVILKLVKL